LAVLQKYPNNNVVLVGHSYGCQLANLAYNRKPSYIKALVLISPAMYIADQDNFRQLLKLPNVIVNLFRFLDSWGNEDSESVYRIVDRSAKVELRRRQSFWGKSNRTDMIRMMAFGQTQYTEVDASNISCPLLIITGKNDKVTPVLAEEDLPRHNKWHLSGAHKLHSAVISNFCNPIEAYKTQSFQPKFPKPFLISNCGHLPQYEHPELVRGIISKFLIDIAELKSMDPSVQLKEKQNEKDKWSVKNFEKWRATQSISSTTIGISLFRAMKVLRENDSHHSPELFLKQYKEGNRSSNDS
jgi:pimeloyl-ACP methyl ester carboxylesterase